MKQPNARQDNAIVLTADEVAANPGNPLEEAIMTTCIDAIRILSAVELAQVGGASTQQFPLYSVQFAKSGL